MTMRTTLRYAAALAALGALALTSAQEPLEHQRSRSASSSSSGISPASRHASAYRAPARQTSAARALPDSPRASTPSNARSERLATDLQRIERLADTAARDAAQARRDATAAQQAARDAALRTR